MENNRKEEENAAMKNSNMTALKAIGIFMIIFALVYALVGTLALAGTLTGVMPGHETQEIMVVALAYAVALLGLICGIVCVKGITGSAKVFGLLFGVLGLAALVYQQVAQDSFSIFDCLAMCFGVAIYYIASQIEKEN